MKPEEQRLALAELCGWEEIFTAGIGDLIGTNKHAMKLIHRGQYQDSYQAIPDYLKDLNAMYVAERWLTVDQSSAYEKKLDEIINRPFTIDNSIRIQPVWHATAAEKAEALLYAIGKWTTTSSPT